MSDRYDIHTIYSNMTRATARASARQPGSGGPATQQPSPATSAQQPGIAATLLGRLRSSTTGNSKRNRTEHGPGSTDEGSDAEMPDLADA